MLVAVAVAMSDTAATYATVESAQAPVTAAAATGTSTDALDVKTSGQGNGVFITYYRLSVDCLNCYYS